MMRVRAARSMEEVEHNLPSSCHLMVQWARHRCVQSYLSLLIVFSPLVAGVPPTTHLAAIQLLFTSGPPHQVFTHSD
jgi:hypothetical protein